MNKKDNILTQIKLKEPKKEVIVSSSEDERERLEKIKNAHKEAQINKYKRDKNSIKDYYDNWDKVDADAELVDVDSGIIINSNSNYVKELYNKKKNLMHILIFLFLLKIQEINLTILILKLKN